MTGFLGGYSKTAHSDRMWEEMRACPDCTLCRRHAAVFEWGAKDDEQKKLLRSHIRRFVMGLADRAADTAEFERLLRNKEYSAAAAIIIAEERRKKAVKAEAEMQRLKGEKPCPCTGIRPDACQCGPPCCSL